MRLQSATQESIIQITVRGRHGTQNIYLPHSCRYKEIIKAFEPSIEGSPFYAKVWKAKVFVLKMPGYVFKADIALSTLWPLAYTLNSIS